LVNTLIEKAKKNNGDKIILSSSEKNLKFYKKLGFQKNEFEMIMRI
jgi:ribosomal protein S18 acetylase RimI-like enzyme